MCRNVTPTLSFWASAARPGTRGRNSLSCHPGRSAARSGALQTRDPERAIHSLGVPCLRCTAIALHRARNDKGVCKGGCVA